MKLLFLIDNLGSGGAQRQVVTISSLLKSKGYDVALLVYGKEDFFESDLKAQGIPLIRCIKPNYIRRMFSVWKKIRQGKYNAVISFLDTPNFINNASSLFMRRKWKVITSERSSKEFFILSKKGRIFSWFQRFSDAIVCNSENARKMWRKHYPQYDHKLHCIYNAVSIQLLGTTYTPRKDGKTHIVVAASYQYLKNPIGLIKAVSLLDENDKGRIRIDWYGNKYINGIDKDLAYKEAQTLISELELAHIIHLHEPTNKITEKMVEADFVGLFSQLEGLPNTICEGMVLGKPIIMTKVSDYEVLVDESNGFLCDWHNVESIKNALYRSINIANKELTQMGQRSHEKALKLFSPSVIADKWEELITCKR